MTFLKYNFSAGWHDSLEAGLRTRTVFILSSAGLILALSLLLMHSVYSEYVPAICLLSAGIFFGLIALSLRLLGRSRREKPPFEIDENSNGMFGRVSGPLNNLEAKAQPVLIPIAAVVGFLALAAIDLWDRTRPR